MLTHFIIHHNVMKWELLLTPFYRLENQGTG